MPPSEPDDLKRLGERIDAAEQKRSGEAETRAGTSAYSIAIRLGSDLIGAVVVGTALGWGIDWAFDHWAGVHTQPAGLIVMFLLGTATGIRNVIRTSQQINAEMASKEK